MFKVIFALRRDMLAAKVYRDHRFLETIHALRGDLNRENNNRIDEDSLEENSYNSDESFDQIERNRRRIGLIKSKSNSNLFRI